MGHVTPSHFLHILNFSPLAATLRPTLVGLLQFLQINCTFDASTARSLWTTCPFCPCFLALWCLAALFSPSTTTLFSRGNTNKTLPVLPRSLPDNIITLSPLLIFMGLLRDWQPFQTFHRANCLVNFCYDVLQQKLNLRDETAQSPLKRRSKSERVANPAKLFLVPN